MSGERSPIPLNYAGKIVQDTDVPNPFAALAVCVPGVLCWAILFSAIVSDFQMKDIEIWFVVGVCCWFMAIIQALASFILYFGKLRYWYVWINFIISGSVLAFTALIIALVFTSALR